MQSGNQALELLSAMAECKVAAKIRNFACDFINGLLKNRSPVPVADLLPGGQGGDAMQQQRQQQTPLPMGFSPGLPPDCVENFGFDVSGFEAGFLNFFQEGDAWGLE
jgi:hypothetical protein